ncbi:hypothetical protein FB451DRAFT_1419901 [Mycena latifolia]|nr:hypothetical protein FB451DRAFT_1419901 [Mycena latifolia]
MLSLTESALEALKEKYPSTPVPDVSYVPLFEDFFNSGSDTAVAPEDLPFECMGPDATALILHSSGSTAFPNPIHGTNHGTIQLFLITWFGERHLTDKILALYSMPMYDGMGIVQTFWAAAFGIVLSFFEPKILQQFHRLKICSTLRRRPGVTSYSVPSFIEAWSHKPDYVQWLATRLGVVSFTSLRGPIQDSL